MIWRLVPPILVTPLLNGAQAAAEAASQLPPAEATTQPISGSADPQLVHSLATGVGAVLIIAVLGYLLVLASRRFKLRPAPRSSSPPLRVLASRRPSARLHLVTVEVAPGRAVVIADNGRSIEKLAEIACDTQTTSESNHSDGRK